MGNDVVHIGITGSYGGNNMGDEAILQSIINQIHESLNAEIVVFSRDPDDTMRRHKIHNAFPVRKMSKRESIGEIEKLDVLIVGGGGILYDHEVKTYLREAQLAHEKGVPVMVYAVGAGPLKDPQSQDLVRTVIEQASVVTVRDKLSMQILEEIGVNREIIVTADPAFLMKPEEVHIDFLLQEGIRKERKLIGMSVREPGKAAPDIKEEHYQDVLANAADYIIDRYNAHIIFVPMERKTAFDLHQSHAVIARMLYPQYASMLEGDYSPGQIMSIIKNFDFVVGMRLHFLFFAALQNVPFVPLPYSSKVHGFLEELNFSTPPFEDLTPGRLISYIDKAWDMKSEIVNRTSDFLPALKKRAHQNNTLLLELLRIVYARRGKSPDSLPRTK
ncbi:MAG TPA: polysaccharide pyruvyl transferase family protein [Chitinispirillaceae bacterium]|nr:polysaccharide pyruvyl transferase family protein [Chitinispirillaceae bacterium]